jgi:hypothetical protein
VIRVATGMLCLSVNGSDSGVVDDNEVSSVSSSICNDDVAAERVVVHW